MARELVSDAFWERIKHLIPPKKPQPEGGRPWLEDRAVQAGIIFVLRSGIPWKMLPKEMGCGSGMTCCRRLRDWYEAGVWEDLYKAILCEMQADQKINWALAIAARAKARAMAGGLEKGPNSTDRGKPGSKHHVLADANGVPLAMVLTEANVHDFKGLIPLVDEVPSVHGLVGHPRNRPDAIQAVTAYDSKDHREELRKRGIRPLIPNRGREHGSGLGKTRWVIERTLSWLHHFRRLQIRWERKPDIHKAFMPLAGALICLNYASWQLR